MSDNLHGRTTRISLTDIDIGGALRKAQQKTIEVPSAEQLRTIGGSFGIRNVKCLAPILLRIVFLISTAAIAFYAFYAIYCFCAPSQDDGGVAALSASLLLGIELALAIAWCLLRIGYEFALAAFVTHGMIREIRDYQIATYDVQIAKKEDLSTICSLQRATRDHISHSSRVIDEAHAEEASAETEG